MINGKKRSTRLRELLEQPGVIVAPCAYDCLSLRIIERAGFKVALHGGYNTAASFLGMPDIGMLTATEMVNYARNMAAAVDFPVICDVDDGFGDIFNVMRTTREVIRSGLAGMYIEDQVGPKRSPSLGGSNVIPVEAMARKLKTVAKVRAEMDPDFVVIARTHASRAVGLEEGVQRGIAYAQAGADIIFVDPGYSEETIDDLKIVAQRIGPYAHVLANMTETVGRPLLTSDELYHMGFKVVIYPMTALMAAARAVTLVMKELQEKGTTKALVDELMPLKEVAQLTGMDKVRALEQEFDE
jgi:2-methylisocitrate lyase-like PEP mutase family enzyme